MKTIKEWAIHISSRFKHEDLIQFINSNLICPCEYFNWDCENCEYRTKPYENYWSYCGCNESKEYIILPSRVFKLIKDQIRELLS